MNVPIIPKIIVTIAPLKINQRGDIENKDTKKVELKNKSNSGIILNKI